VALPGTGRLALCHASQKAIGGNQSAVRLDKKGMGFLRVAATVGKTTWDTSIFPDRRSDAYLLPLKADVRTREGIGIGDTISFMVEIKT
jgi:hypothetical protein